MIGKNLLQEQSEIQGLPDETLASQLKLPPGQAQINGMLAAIEMSRRAQMRRSAQMTAAGNQVADGTVVDQLTREAQRVRQPIQAPQMQQAPQSQGLAGYAQGGLVRGYADGGFVNRPSYFNAFTEEELAEMRRLGNATSPGWLDQGKSRSPWLIQQPPIRDANAENSGLYNLSSSSSSYGGTHPSYFSLKGEQISEMERRRKSIIPDWINQEKAREPRKVLPPVDTMMILDPYIPLDESPVSVPSPQETALTANDILAQLGLFQGLDERSLINQVPMPELQQFDQKRADRMNRATALGQMAAAFADPRYANNFAGAFGAGASNAAQTSAAQHTVDDRQRLLIQEIANRQADSQQRTAIAQAGLDNSRLDRLGRRDQGKASVYTSLSEAQENRANRETVAKIGAASRQQGHMTDLFEKKAQFLSNARADYIRAASKQSSLDEESLVQDPNFQAGLENYMARQEQIIDEMIQRSGLLGNTLTPGGSGMPGIKKVASGVPKGGVR